MTKEERIKKMEQRHAELKAFDSELRNKGYKIIIGVDEVGRGPLAGPVVTAAVVLPENFSALGVDDSKKVSEKKRKELFNVIKESAIAYAFGISDCNRIDQVNILNATKEAMTQAVKKVIQKLEKKCINPDLVLIDALTLDDVNIPQKNIIKGDSTSLSIAAASILAKVERDTMMEELDLVWPGYGFASNKGYGTKEHYRGLDKHGISPVHRKSFLKKYSEGME